MGVELHCEGCGKLLRASNQLAGKQSKCPACGHSVYIPTPEDQLEELPLAPEDTDDLKREAALQEERHRLERILVREESLPAEGGTSLRGVNANSPKKQADEVNIEEAVVAYLVALRDSDLNDAEKSLAILQRKKGEVRKILDRFTADQLAPMEMANVPRAVYEGFLKNLRSQL